VKFWILAAALAAMGAAGQPAAAANDTAAKFGARDAVLDISLAPDGKALAVVRPTEGSGAAVFVTSLVGTPEMKPILKSSGSPDRLRYCRWTSNTRLICAVFMVVDFDGRKLGFTRLVAVNSDGSNLKQLSAKESSNALSISTGGGEIIDWIGDGSSGSVLMARYFAPETSTGTMLSQKQEGYGVERIDTVTMARTTVEPPNEAAQTYISDGRGVVRIEGIQPSTNTGLEGNRIIYRYRKAGSREWLPLATATIVNGDRVAGFQPVAVDPDLDVVYGFDSENGRQALFKIALDGSMKRDLVSARPDVDVDGLTMVGRQQRVVGVDFTIDKKQSIYFDPAFRQLASALGKALPGKQISFLDASSGESRLLLWAGSDVAPGDFYLFDKTTKQLQEILPVRPELEKTVLSETKPISFPASDGTMIPGYLTLPPGSDGKNIPAIVMPHGGPASRDVWGFDFLAQYFANRGFAVLQPNYRGSTGYGDAWFGKNGFQNWRLAIGDVNDAGRWLVKQGIANPGKLGIFGWSYGGYAALQSAVLDPSLFKAIVAVAPVTDLPALLEEHRDSYDLPQIEAQIGKGPHLVEGSPARNAGRITAPVLLFHGEDDATVRISQSRLMVSKLKSAGRTVELVEFRKLDHQLDDNVVRTEMLDKADAFLRASLKM